MTYTPVQGVVTIAQDKLLGRLQCSGQWGCSTMWAASGTGAWGGGGVSSKLHKALSQTHVLIIPLALEKLLGTGVQAFAVCSLQLLLSLGFREAQGTWVCKENSGIAARVRGAVFPGAGCDVCAGAKGEEEGAGPVQERLPRF